MLADYCLSCPVCLSVTLVYCGETVGWMKMKLGIQVGLGPGHTVLDGDPAPPQKRHSHQFLADVYCGQMAVCIRIPLGTEVGLRLGDIVLDGDTGLPPLMGHNPQFSANVCCGQTAGWTNMPLGTGVDLDPGHIVLDMDPAPPPSKRTQQPPPLFSAHVYCGHSHPSQLLHSRTYHTTTTILRPFFQDHTDEPVPEDNFWTLWCKGRLTEADTLTIRLGATPTGPTSAHLHHPHHHVLTLLLSNFSWHWMAYNVLMFCYCHYSVTHSRTDIS